MTKIFSASNFVVPFLILFSLIGCERKSKDIPAGPGPTVESYLSQGWAAFESGNYMDAANRFSAARNRDAISIEAYLGLGWSYFRLGNFSASISNFDLALSIEGITDKQIADSYAGKAGAYAGAGDDSLAVLEAKNHLTVYPSGYVFDHDNSITTRAIQLLIANSYYNYKDFYSAQEAIIEYLESNWLDNLIQLDPNLIGVTETYIASVDTTIDTLAVPWDTTIVSSITITGTARDTLVNLIDIKSVKEGTSEYSVARFQHGGDLVILENNAELLNGDSLEVAYVTAVDYGKFLIELLKKLQNLYSS